jgi:hypothetical protein
LTQLFEPPGLAENHEWRAVPAFKSIEYGQRLLRGRKCEDVEGQRTGASASGSKRQRDKRENILVLNAGKKSYGEKA